MFLFVLFVCFLFLNNNVFVFCFLFSVFCFCFCCLCFLFSVFCFSLFCFLVSVFVFVFVFCFCFCLSCVCVFCFLFSVLFYFEICFVISFRCFNHCFVSSIKQLAATFMFTVESLTQEIHFDELCSMCNCGKDCAEQQFLNALKTLRNAFETIMGLKHVQTSFQKQISTAEDIDCSSQTARATVSGGTMSKRHYSNAHEASSV